MDSRTQTHALVTVILLVVTALVLAVRKEPVVSEATDLRQELPDAVGDYKGSALFFCQNELCEVSIRPVEDYGRKRICPKCGGRLDSLSLAEMKMLPSDTIIATKRYQNSRGEVVLASIVTTGNERKSIHRPEVCLPAQGFVVESSSVIPVQVKNRAPLDVRLLLIRSTGRRPENPSEAGFSSFAYWFAGGGRETPSHLKRVLWSSADRVFHSVISRWSYVAVFTNRRDFSDDATGRICVFIGDLHPLIAIPAQNASPRASN